MKNILVIAPYFFPAVNGGGPIISLMNLIKEIKNYNIDIFTRKNDYGSPFYKNIYSGIKYKYEDSNLYYSENMKFFLLTFFKINKKRNYDIIYINSFFDLFCIKSLLLSLIFTKSKIIIAPRGELSEGCLSIKKYKKKLYLFIYRILINPYKSRLFYHATNLAEKNEIIDYLRVENSNINICSNIPNKSVANIQYIIDNFFNKKIYKIVMYSRVSEEKNLMFALKALSLVNLKIEFDIIGPISPPSIKYYEKCKLFISKLNSNITVKYLGSITQDQILEIIPNYDLALYPTLGDNFAHSVADVLRSGVKILISPYTPWNDLNYHGFGVVLEIDNPRKWADEIIRDILISPQTRLNNKKHIIANISKYKLFNDINVESIFNV